MADVILFRPKEVYSSAVSTYRPPLGLLYIAASLKHKGFSVTIIDTETTEDWLGRLQSEMTDKVIMAGVGVMTGHQIKGALDFSRALKQHISAPVVWGGLHPSLLPEQTARHELVDVVVIGEGEETVAALAERIRSGASLDSVPGVIFKKGTDIVQTPPKKAFLDMDTLELPDYALVDVAYYASRKREFMARRKKCLDINMDRGCPYRCGFCYNLKFNRRQWRGVSAEKGLDNIETLLKRYELDAVNFTSDNFFVKKERVRKICTGLLERKLDIAWHADMRIDNFLSYEEDLLRLIKQSGCVELTFGVESGSERVLDYIYKDITVPDVLKAHDRAKSFGFKVNYHFMIGFPEETRSDVIATLKLIYLLTRQKNTKVYGPSIYIPYPGTTLFEKSVACGFKPPEHLEGWITYDWENTSKFSWFSQGYKRYLTNVQFVAFRAAIPQTNFIRWLIRKYFRLRLLGLMYGLYLSGLDIVLARLCFALARRFR